MYKPDESWTALIVAIMLSLILLAIVFYGILYYSDQSFDFDRNHKSRGTIDLKLYFENETSFIFQIPVIYIFDSSIEPPKRISPALENLTLVKEKSDYTNISISILSNSINGSIIEYLHINGTGRVFSFHSELAVDMENLRPNFDQLSNNAIYLETASLSNMTLSLDYFGQDASFRTSNGCEIDMTIFENITVENGWKLYNFSEEVSMTCVQY